VVLSRVGALVSEAAGAALATGRVAVRVGIGQPLVRPDRLLGMAGALRHWGMSPGAVCAVNAARDPGRVAVIDDRERVTWADLDRRSTAVATALADRGVVAGDAVALLARNSAAFVVAQAAISKLGADILYANTGFAAPQLGEVLQREGTVAVVADDEFDPLLDEAVPDLPRLTAWVEDGSAPDLSFAAVDATTDPPALPSPGRDSRHVILTSGTTGAPRGAARSVPAPLAAVAAAVSLLDAIPYRPRRTTLLAAPAFHAWGLGNLVVASLLSSTIVMSRRFDPAHTLDLVAEHGVDTLVGVPVMCERLLDVDPAPATPSLRVAAVSGSALAPTLPARFMDRFGDVLYNLYGSTEVAFVSVAGPHDLRVAPTSAGRVLRGVRVALVDDDEQPVAPGEVGRIFAGSGLSFEGYTSGEDKVRIGSLASIGDLGHFGSDGRLYVEGRDDDMVISGGENVYPAEVEELLHHHPAVADVAVVGVTDERFGQALVAHVVRRRDADVRAEELRRYVRTHLANYKVPREVVFHDRLPRNETGKVIKRELARG